MYVYSGGSREDFEGGGGALRNIYTYVILHGTAG